MPVSRSRFAGQLQQDRTPHVWPFRKVEEYPLAKCIEREELACLLCEPGGQNDSRRGVSANAHHPAASSFISG